MPAVYWEKGCGLVKNKAGRKRVYAVVDKRMSDKIRCPFFVCRGRIRKIVVPFYPYVRAVSLANRQKSNFYAPGNFLPKMRIDKFKMGGGV